MCVCLVRLVYLLIRVLTAWLIIMQQKCFFSSARSLCTAESVTYDSSA
jgi:hypothetical protein